MHSPPACCTGQEEQRCLLPQKMEPCRPEHSSPRGHLEPFSPILISGRQHRQGRRGRLDCRAGIRPQPHPQQAVGLRGGEADGAGAAAGAGGGLGCPRLALGDLLRCAAARKLPAVLQRGKGEGRGGGMVRGLSGRVDGRFRASFCMLRPGQEPLCRIGTAGTAGRLLLLLLLPHVSALQLLGLWVDPALCTLRSIRGNRETEDSWRRQVS